MLPIFCLCLFGSLFPFLTHSAPRCVFSPLRASTCIFLPKGCPQAVRICFAASSPAQSRQCLGIYISVVAFNNDQLVWRYKYLSSLASGGDEAEGDLYHLSVPTAGLTLCESSLDFFSSLSHFPIPPKFFLGTLA